MDNATIATVEACLPPGNAENGSVHWLLAEGWDVTDRERFPAKWQNGMWEVKGLSPLSPRKAAWAGWTYEKLA